MGRVWQHTSGQLSLLRQAVLAPPEVFTFKHAKNKVLPVEGLQGVTSSVGAPNEAWLCRQLYQVLSKLEEAGHSSAIHEMLEQPLQQCPEVSREGAELIEQLPKRAFGKSTPHARKPDLRSGRAGLVRGTRHNSSNRLGCAAS